MRKLALTTGILLILLGVITYFLQAAENRSPTALIPAAIGMPFVIAAALATTPARNKHAMHVAATFALLGTGVLGMALPKLVKAAQGVPLARPLATWAQLGTGMICLVFLVAAIRSFVTARLLRQQG